MSSHDSQDAGVAVPHRVVRVFDDGTAPRQQQQDRLVQALRTADSRWNDETGDEPLSDPYLVQIADAALRHLHKETTR